MLAGRLKMAYFTKNLLSMSLPVLPSIFWILIQRTTQVSNILERFLGSAYFPWLVYFGLSLLQLTNQDISL